MHVYDYMASLLDSICVDNRFLMLYIILIICMGMNSENLIGCEIEILKYGILQIN